MMSSPGNLYVRANYLAVAVFGPLLAALPASFELSATFARGAKDWLAITATIVFIFCLFFLPGLRALRRLFRNGTVIPPELVGERPVVSLVVTLFGSFAHLFFLLTMAMAIGIALAPEWPEEAKKILGPLVVGLMSYFVALWCGELALVGDGRSDAAEELRSGPIC